jgi:hypothetical protein
VKRFVMLLKNPPPPELSEPDELDELPPTLGVLAGAVATAESGTNVAAFDAGAAAVVPKVAVSQPLRLEVALEAGSDATTTDSDASGALLMPASR